MKLQPDKSDVQLIGSHGSGWLMVSRLVAGSAQHDKVEHSLVLGSRGERAAWGVTRFEDLAPSHFEQLALLKPEMVIFGSGSRLRFAHPRLQVSLMQARIGLETMDTIAACRTYNILASEGRHVVAALLLENP
jgi:uncharacterized protein